MSSLFKTDNIFYLPPDKPFRVYDLMDWRRIDIRVQSLQTLLRQDAFATVHERAERVLESQDLLEGQQRDEQAKRMETFLHTLPLNDRPRASTSEVQKAFEPMRATFWVRMSQAPTESFFQEDYLERPQAKPGAPVVLSSIGAVAFNAMGEIECELPSERPHSFDFAAAGDLPITEIEALAPDEPLPLLREYCGFKGSSNQGEMVTIDLKAQIPDECLAAIPIRRESDVRFETLYLHLQTLVGDRAPIFPFRMDREKEIAGKLKEAGFVPTKRSKRFSVWERSRDTIQLYRLLEGKESEDVPMLPPFCLATQADGSAWWEDRVNLLEAVFLG